MDILARYLPDMCHFPTATPGPLMVQIPEKNNPKTLSNRNSNCAHRYRVNALRLGPQVLSRRKSWGGASRAKMLGGIGVWEL